MASLSNTKISDTYPLLLKIETNGVDGNLRSIEDGDGTTSALKISSGAIQVDNIKVDGNAITSTDTDGNIDLTPNGSGEVNISKVDIDSGAIDGTPIGANSANTGAFTTISASSNVDFNGDLDVDGTTNLDVVDIDGAVDMASTLGVAGVVTANAGVVVDNITIDGTEIDLSSGNLTLDVAGSIILNADGGQIQFHDAGTEIGVFENSSTDFVMESKVQDKDIIFKGNHGGSGITALTLDMSEGGLVGVGTSSPSSYDNYYNNLVVYENGNAGIAIIGSTSGESSLGFGDGTSAATYRGAVAYVHTSGDHQDKMFFKTSATNQMVIDSSGNVGIGTTSPGDYSTSADDLVVKNSDHAGITIVSPTDKSGNLFFADGTSGDAQYRGFIQYDHGNNATDAMMIGTAGAERMRITSGGNVLIGKTDASFNVTGTSLMSDGRIGLKTDGQEGLNLNRAQDGAVAEFRSADTAEGTISISGSTVSYNGFSGSHESSGIPTNTAIGTVVSTIDELDVYPDTDYKTGEAHNKAGETRADHAKIKVSDSVGDKRVYGVLASFNEDNKPIVASVGIGSVKVTGACQGGDLLESNGDGTAKVQDDDIIRSKTIGKVTIGDSDTGVKLVSCVLYCG